MSQSATMKGSFMLETRRQSTLLITLITLGLLLAGCASEPESPINIEFRSRQEAIPANAVKVTSEQDSHPPVLYSDEWTQPVPVSGLINTAGAEDSPFITPDGKTLIFFFTPDVRKPVQVQLIDGATGLYISHNVKGEWQEPQRVILQDPQEMAMDGCPFLLDDVLWFCSARTGNYRSVDLWHAEFQDGEWKNWENAGKTLNLDYEVGEMHISQDGRFLFFHSERMNGQGEYDIWMSSWENGNWTQPTNIWEINTEITEGWPFITEDGEELWFLRTYEGTPAIYRSEYIDGEWSEPELILSQFAAEPSLDQDGNIYFAHHYFEDSQMIEADIYVAFRK